MEKKKTREEVLEKVSKSGDLLSFYPEYKDDEEIAFSAQQVMPVAKEGVEEMTPAAGKVAEEVAKGIKKGLNDEK